MTKVVRLAIQKRWVIHSQVAFEFHVISELNLIPSVHFVMRKDEILINQSIRNHSPLKVLQRSENRYIRRFYLTLIKRDREQFTPC